MLSFCRFIKSNIGYFIAYQHLFSTWIEHKGDFDVSHVRDALSAFGRLIHPNHKRLFEGIFKTLETGLSKLGDTAAKQTKAMFGGIPQSELNDLADSCGYWQAFPSLRSALFTDAGTPYVTPQVQDLAQATHEHAEVKKFGESFCAAFTDFNPWLRRTLLDQMLTLNVNGQEALISEELFARLAPLPLIDRYHAYQILDDHWHPPGQVASGCCGQ